MSDEERKALFQRIYGSSHAMTDSILRLCDSAERILPDDAWQAGPAPGAPLAKPRIIVVDERSAIVAVDGVRLDGKGDES